MKTKKAKCEMCKVRCRVELSDDLARVEALPDGWYYLWRSKAYLCSEKCLNKYLLDKRLEELADRILHLEKCWTATVKCSHCVTGTLAE